MEGCVFCRIAAGEIPAAVLLENETVLGFLDIAPVNPGHCLVVPRRHVGSLLEMNGQELAACMEAVRRLARAAVEAAGAEGFNVLQNNGRCAGQLVPHAHFHVIPRSSGDGFSFGWRQGAYGEGEMEAMRRRIRALL